MTKRSKAKWILYGIIVLLVAAAVLFLMGPRTEVSTRITFDATTVGEDIEDYLASREARFTDIREGLQKQIVWAYPLSKAKTPLSIVYVHGFSASLGEVRPLPDMVAERLGANLFFTRLTGHGRTGDAMGEATVEAWINDMAEAIEIGRRLGERVIIMGTSTGGSLDTWAAAQPRLINGVAGIVNISPNYGVNDPAAAILTWPWARQIAELVVGERRSFEPVNDLHKRFWTHEYPTAAVLPMAELVKLTNAAEIHNIQVPALFIFSEKDTVVRPDKTREIAETWGARTQIVVIDNSEDPDNHVIAGDAKSPSTTGEIADIVTDWIEAL
ncbi:MAG: lysophospholipase [Alphaproteobacteria bacterium]|nr:lysophospholipase [Alphaproteobacteria bacterium]